MRTALACFSVSVLATISFGIGKQEPTQEKPKENPPPAADAAKPAGAERKNPVTPTAEENVWVRLRDVPRRRRRRQRRYG
jgi:hypothetical protein